MKTKTTLEKGVGVGVGGRAGIKRVERGEIGQQFTALTNIYTHVTWIALFQTVLHAY